MDAPLKDHILLADDDRDHSFLFKRVLWEIAPEKMLSSVYDGEALIDYLSLTVPELLFLDLNMPNRDGLECLQEIRLNPDLDGLKVVVYSSSTRMTDIQRSYLHKADLYMVKPFSAVHLKSALQKLLEEEVWRINAAKKVYYINNQFVPFTAQIS